VETAPFAAQPNPDDNSNNNNLNFESKSTGAGVTRNNSASTTSSGTTSGSSTGAAARYTREERIWLHGNYRGEAPFLQAWGLDIRRGEDREEGMRLVRELMGAERGPNSNLNGNQRSEGGNGGGGGGEDGSWSQGRYELL
jgi:hypothetical protein